MALTVLSAWIAFVAWRERRRWLLTWSGIYGAVAVCMTILTYFKVPKIRDSFQGITPIQLAESSAFGAMRCATTC